MKITKAILASNDSPMYLDFWPIVAEGWKRLDIEPVLFCIGEDRSAVDESVGEVVYCNNLGIHSAFHAQCIRLLAPASFPNDTCIISDIDLLPLSYQYCIL